MLFVADPKKAGHRDIVLIHLLPTVIIFVAFMGATLWAWQTAKERDVSQKTQIVDQEVERVESRLQDRMDDYQQILLSANGLFQASDSVSRSEWKTFYQNYDIPNRYPGLPGIAFAEAVPAGGLAVHEARLRAEGFTDYRVTPVGQRDLYVPITYPITDVTPENYKSLSGFGFDITTDPARSHALQSARETGRATLTGKLSLMQSNQQEPAFILYQPVYSKADHSSLAGFAYAPFTAKNLFEGVFGAKPDGGIGFSVYDQTAAPENLLYQNEAFKTANGTATQRSITVAGRLWVLEFKAPESLLNDPNRRNPTATLIAGIIFSALIAGLVLSLLLSRTRSLAFAENTELQRAKDDLLSIASHQLRTPATGVKQYIGMLQEGYAGKISRKQQNLLKEAYTSNERQLAIIDEILHVARIDTGRLVLQPERLKIRDVIDLVLREQASAIKTKSQKILTSFPKKVIYARGDREHIRMALDNIVSNAIKYTPEKGTITLKIKRSGDFVAISVTDTGVGIDKKDLDQLFQKFSRIPNELSRQTAGSGLGLYIAQQIIELHGGRIEVDSHVGKGTTFTILLPLALRKVPGDKV